MNGGNAAWAVHQQLPEGTIHCTNFPIDTIEHRAAEYGFDISTPETRAVVIDLILHEPWMPAVDPMALWRSGQGKSLPEDEIHLWNAPSVAAAKAAYLEKLATTKKNLVLVMWPKTTEAMHPMLKQLVSHEGTQAGVDDKRRRVLAIRHSFGLESGLTIDQRRPSKQTAAHQFAPKIPEIEARRLKLAGAANTLEIAKSNGNQ
jgi:hypothetical protein